MVVALPANFYLRPVGPWIGMLASGESSTSYEVGK